MRCLIKDRRVLDLIWRIVKDGVRIGSYTSQWFANTVLQPLDQMIRDSGCAPTMSGTWTTSRYSVRISES